MEQYEPETEIEEYNNIPKKEFEEKQIESTIYNIPFLNDEYDLTIKLINHKIDLRLQQKNFINNYYYNAILDFQTLNKLLLTSFKEIEEVFNFYDKIYKDKKIKLIQLKTKNTIMLNFKNKDIETNLELKKVKLTKDEVYSILLDEVNSLKKKIASNKKEDLIIEDNNKIKEYVDSKIEKYKNIMAEKDNEIKKLKESINIFKKEQEEKIKQIQNKSELKFTEFERYLKPFFDKQKEKELKEFNRLNDNVNLLNDFKNFNVDKMEIKKDLVNNLNISIMKSVAVYEIIRNDEILYELAYPDNKIRFDIIIYNLSTNNVTNKINKAHNKTIHLVKHYYDYSSKNHILLTSSADKSIKSWNISSNPVSNILNIQDCFDGYNWSPFCLMFNKNNYYIFGGSFDKKKKIWNKEGKFLGAIEKSNLEIGTFIETTYINNKPYILLSGDYYSESYDYNNNDIKIYKSKDKNNGNLVINLFKNINKIYLIIGLIDGTILIFDFISTNEIGSISLKGSIFSLCSLNEKNILVGNNQDLTIIDFETKSIIKNFKWHNKSIYGIEKLKINDEEEIIISYDENEIILWK